MNNTKTKKLTLLAALTATTMLSGCASVMSATTSLSDERVVDHAAPVIGVKPDQLTVLKRRDGGGGSTVVTLETKKDKKHYTCEFNSGNLFSLWTVSAPYCSEGDSVKFNQSV